MDRYHQISFTSSSTSTTTLLQISLTIGTSLTTAIRIDTSLHSYSITCSIKSYIKKTIRHLTSPHWFSTIILVMGRLQVVSSSINTAFSDISLNLVSWINDVDRVFIFTLLILIRISHPNQKSSLATAQKYKNSFTISIYWGLILHVKIIFYKELFIKCVRRRLCSKLFVRRGFTFEFSVTFLTTRD